MKLANTLKYLFIAAIFTAVAPSFATDKVKVKEVKDLKAVGKHADNKRMPILLMFSAEGCHYCMRVENEFLKPMLLSGDYGDRVLIRQMKIDSFDKIRDFEGKKVTAADFADRYNVFVTPTVVFIDGDGVELAEKRVGLTTPDFYGGYLDQSINEALNILRRDKPMRVKLSSLED